MWSVFLTRPLGSLSVRRITLFALALVMALFVGATSHNVYAQETTNTDNTLTHEGKTYSELTPIPKDDPTFKSSVCGANTITAAYFHINRTNDDSPADGVSVICTKNISSDEFFIVTFPNAKVAIGSGSVSTYGTLTEQEGNDIDAIQRRYDFKGLPESTSSNTITDDKVRNANIPLPAVVRNTEAYNALYQKFSNNIQNEGPITLASGSFSNNTADRTSATTTCSSEHTKGLGWIICPVTNWIASAMDSLYGILVGFLTVGPLSTDRDSALYYIWGLLRNVANIFFIIGFLIVIYSQTTGIGLSTYGIKRLLPRILIAAVLVNISYWVVAIAVDLSNFLGVNLQNLFVEVRENMPVSEKVNLEPKDVTWEALSGAILSGGTAGIMIAGTLFGFGASAGASLFLLLPVIVGVIVSALVAILVLAARQALITILIIISPLAFVAFMLPSTEKYFDRWRSLLTTMLLVFPAFALVFGGAQLAGMAIISGALDNPDSRNFFNVIILGMAVQVAPLIITPLLIKLSGSLLGRIAGIVNDPNRGMIDRTKKFAQKRHDVTKNRQIYDFDKKTGRFKNNNPLAAAARWNALREIDSARKLKAWEATADTLYASDARSHEVHAQNEISSMRKSIGDDSAKKSFAEDIASQSALRILDSSSRLLKDQAAVAESKNKSFYEALQAKPGIASAAIRDIGGDSQSVKLLEKIANSSQETAYETKMESDRQSNIANTVSDAYYSEMVNNKTWQEYAGAAKISDHGELRTKANAQSKIMASSSERVSNYQKGYLFDKISKDEILAKAATHNPDNEEEWEAAIKYVLDSKDTDNIIKLSEQIDLAKAPPGIRQVFELEYKNSPVKPIYASAGKLGAVGQGIGLDSDGMRMMDQWRLEAAQAGKYGTADLVRKASKEEIGRLAELLTKENGKYFRQLTREQQKVLHDAVREVFKDGRFRAEMGDREDNLRRLGQVFNFQEDDYKLRSRD